jgi:hypothetical protein
MAGSGRYPASDWQWAPAPTVAHWTSDPQYSYDQFNRPITSRVSFADDGVPDAVIDRTGPELSLTTVQTKYPTTTTRVTEVPTVARGGVTEGGSRSFATKVARKNGSYGSCGTCGASGAQQCLTNSGRPTRPHRKRGTARRNTSVIPLSRAPAEETAWPMAQNAGPYLPQMFPYGQGGRPSTYSLREAGLRVTRRNPGKIVCIYCDAYGVDGETDEPCPGCNGSGHVTRQMPLKTYKKKLKAVQAAFDARRNPSQRELVIATLAFMSKGGGDRRLYSQFIRGIAATFSPEAASNKAIWTAYRRHAKAIAKHSTRKMPTMATLRKVRSNPRRRGK